VGDLVAALTVTAVAAPEAVSYAGIAGLPGQQGLYTGLLGPLAYAIAGASPQLMVGPTAIMCILTHNAIPNKWGGVSVAQCATSGAPGCDTRIALAGLLAIVMALLQAAIGLLQLGSLVTLVSVPVVAGFTTGSALLTASSQFSTLFSLQTCTTVLGKTSCKASKCAATDEAGEPIGCTFGQAVVDVFARWDTINWGVVGLGVGCIALLYAVRALPMVLGKGFKLLASLAPLVLVLVIIPLSYGYQGYFCGKLSQCASPIPSGLPPLADPFQVLARGTPSDLASLVQAALPLAIIGYMGAVTIAKTISRQYGPYAVYASSELWGQVAANAACGLGSAIPVTGSFSRSAVNCSSGARTGAASVLTGLCMALALLCLTTPLAYIPPVARSAIVLVAIGKMIELHLLPLFWAGEKRDALVFVVTLGVVLFMDSASGLLAGCLVQWVCALLRSSAEPTPVSVHAWLAGAGGAASGSGGAGAAALPEGGEGEASLALQARGMVWGHCSGAPPPAAPTTASASSACCCATLHWAPDLHFSSTERLSEAATEAMALLQPAALVVNVGGIAPGQPGLFLDATGANDLFNLPALLPQGTCLIVCGLGGRALAHLHSVWTAADGGAGAGAGEGAGAPPPGSTKAWREACEAAVVGAGGFCFGSLYALDTAESAMRVAREVCALRLRGPDTYSLNKAGGGAGSPLLEGGEEGQEGGEEGAEGGGSSGAGACLAKKKLGPVEAVPPSPLAIKATAVRLAKGLPVGLSPRAQMAAFKVTLDVRAAQEKGLLADATRLATEVLTLGQETLKYFKGESSLLVGVAHEDGLIKKREGDFDFVT
jgi:SulP family sulfate permease